jgi:hypothetical protein
MFSEKLRAARHAPAGATSNRHLPLKSRSKSRDGFKSGRSLDAAISIRPFLLPPTGYWVSLAPITPGARRPRALLRLARPGPRIIAPPSPAMAPIPAGEVADAE